MIAISSRNRDFRDERGNSNLYYQLSLSGHDKVYLINKCNLKHRKYIYISKWWLSPLEIEISEMRKKLNLYYQLSLTGLDKVYLINYVI